jgi:hypothetical protein
MLLDQKKLKRICDELLACHDDDSALKKAEKLRSAVHQHIQELRRKLIIMPPPRNSHRVGETLSARDR